MRTLIQHKNADNAMKFSNLTNAQNTVYRAFETTGTSLHILMMEGYYYVTTGREAAKLEKQGYEVCTFH